MGRWLSKVIPSSLAAIARILDMLAPLELSQSLLFEPRSGSELLFGIIKATV